MPPVKEETQSCADNERILREAAAAYYNGKPIMSDEEYDRIWRNHQANRRMLPDDPVWKDTILDQVGAAPAEDSGFEKVKHSSKMLSLDNVFAGDDTDDLDELVAWIAKMSETVGPKEVIIVEPKLDGLSIRLTYKDYKLVRAVTRGDGEMGEDITRNVLAAGLAPRELMNQDKLHSRFEGNLELNGEIYMPYFEFEALNHGQLSAGEEPYANPRNAAAGLIRRHDVTKVPKRSLKLQIHGIPGALIWSSYGRAVVDLHKMGFVCPAAFGIQPDPGLTEFKTGTQLKEHIDQMAEAHEGSGAIPIDGAVFKLDNLETRFQLGETSRAPRWAVALKFQQPRVQTTLKDITIQIGRSGVLTPVAELEPVEVDGTVVSRASLHNEDQINRLKIEVGDVVEIRKAGAIIPEVVRSLGAEERDEENLVTKAFNLPDYAKKRHPEVDYGEITLRKPRATGKSADDTAKVWVCSNPSMAARIEHMAGRARLDLDQLGTEACEAIGQRAGGDEIGHHFDVLTKDKAFFASLSWATESGGRMTFGESRAEKVMAAIAKTRSLGLNRWIASLGIPSVGDNTSKEISRLCADRKGLLAAAWHPNGVFVQMVRSLKVDKAKADYEKHKKAYGISHHLGPVSLKALVEFVANNREIIDKIPLTVESDNYNLEPPTEKDGPLNGKVFVITGTLSQPRPHFKALVEENGGTAAGSISKKVHYLLAGEKAGSKLKKANDAGIPVIDEEAFLKMIIES